MTKETFKDAADKKPQKSEAEQFLDDLKVPYEKLPDGTWIVHGDILIKQMNLTKLPDLSHVIVEGDFDCSKNLLESLAGSPKAVTGAFLCEYNQLTSLIGGPKEVGEDFWCYGNWLDSLEGAPEKFKLLNSNFGTVYSWEDVPEEQRLSPETRAQMEKEAAEKEAMLERQRSPALHRDLVVRPQPLVPRK